MAKLLGLAMFLSVATTHTAYAKDDIPQVAAEAGVDAQLLAEALEVQHLTDARTYLESVGELTRPKPPEPLLSARVACIIRLESKGDANATNPYSKARGLGQFLDSTWATTPQGKAGFSPYNAVANLAAIQYMIDAGRAREFVAVSAFGC